MAVTGVTISNRPGVDSLRTGSSPFHASARVLLPDQRRGEPLPLSRYCFATAVSISRFTISQTGWSSSIGTLAAVSTVMP